MGKEPNYTCPHIDAVLDPLKEVFQILRDRFGKQTVEELEELHEALLPLKDSAERELERVRSICEELRAQRREYEEQVDELQEKADRLTDEKQDLEDRVQELEFQLESLQGE